LGRVPFGRGNARGNVNTCNIMVVEKEGAFMVYKDDVLVAIIKRDKSSAKHLVYMLQEATSDDIAELLMK
jgi:hypothetical protein